MARGTFLSKYTRNPASTDDLIDHDAVVERIEGVFPF
jgi:hypothetical protein